MDDKLLQKRLRSKIAMHMLFGLGGAVVIIGALFKILHLEIGPITGGLVLGLGLGTEALIFTVAALNTGEIKEEHSDFVKKVKGGTKAPSGGGGDSLSSKIDELMKEAKLDVSLMNNLTKSIKNLEASAQALTPAAAAASSSQNYADQLTHAAGQLEKLNNLYAAQVSAAGDHTQFNTQVAQNAEQLRSQMEALSANLANLNKVYGGMLTAMNKQ
jgi:gliding motility-associated protein GldL